MEQPINILLPYGYADITDSDIREGKNYILRRERTAQALSSLVDALLEDTAERITMLCYRYNVDPKRFKISESYNKELFKEISDILDETEDGILDLIGDYSTRCTDDERRKSALLAWVVLLGKGNRNLRETLESRLWQFSRDLEAMIAAVRLANVSLTDAITRIKSNLRTVYDMKEVKAAFPRAAEVMATYIRSRGVKYGNVGNSNSEMNNIERFARMTVQMAWMREQLEEFKEDGADGFVQLRGSNYPCATCDDAAHFYDNIDDMLSMPYPHYHCMCYRVPVYKQKQ